MGLDHASGKTKEADYQRQLAAPERARLDAQLVLAGEYEQDNAAILKKDTDFEIAQRTRATEDKKKQAQTKQQIQDASFQAAAASTDLLIELFGKESAAGQAALITKQTLAIAEIAINLQKQLSANATYAATLGPFGPIYLVATDALAIVSAATTANVLKLQRGGIAYGLGHEDGGIPLYHRGQPAGIEIEGGEPVLTRAVSQNPLLLSLASTVNQLAGGRALALSTNLPAFPRMALGGLAIPLVRQQLRGEVGQAIDYERLAQATAKALRQSPPRAIISNVKAGLERDGFTQAQANS